MSEKKSVLAVVLNYRGEGVLLPCLASLWPELDACDACLVIDNGQEEKLMQEVKAKYPEIRILSLTQNVGFGRGMNTGLALAQKEGFEAVWILNNDALIQRGALTELKGAKVKYPGTHLFSPLILNGAGEVWFAGGKINFWRMRTEHIQALPKKDEILETDFLTGCALFIPKETLDRVGYFDERYFLYYEDAEYSQRTLSAGGKLWVVPKARVLHHEVSVANPEKTYWLVRSGVEFFLRHTPGSLLPWVKTYFFLRRCKNLIKLAFSKDPLARSVKRAYTDASIE